MWRILLFVVCAGWFVSVPLSVMACTDKPTGPVRSYESLCILMKDADKVANRIVRVESMLESDGMHGSWLQDYACAAKVLLRTAETARNRRDIRELENTI